MPARKQSKVPVACPQCGHTQEEPRSAYSTTCKKCGKYYRVQDVLKPAAKPRERKRQTLTVNCPHCGNAQEEAKGAFSTQCKKCQQHFRIEDALKPAVRTEEKAKEVRVVHCFQCQTRLEVAPAAQSTMCKRCSSFVDLRDYVIDHSIAKNFRTRGRFVIEEKGYVFNTDTVAGSAVIKGKLQGRIATDADLEIHSTADIRGSFQAGKLVIPAGHRFGWPNHLVVGGADIGGELNADLRTEGTIELRSNARLFGDIEARHLIVESGAVLVGNVKIGVPTDSKQPARPE